MKTRMLAIIALGIAPALSSRAATNSWIGGNEKWQKSSDWSLSVSPSTNGQSAILITNAGNNTVTIDTTTPAANRTVSNLALNANSLSVSGSFIVEVVNLLSLGNNSTLAVNGSEVDVIGGVLLGSSGSGNQIIITNATEMDIVGSTIIGGVSGSNNSVLVTGGSGFETDGNLIVQNSAPGVAIKVTTGGALLPGNAFIGSNSWANGNVVLVADPGSILETGGNLNIGGAGHGSQLVISNGAGAFINSGVVIGDPAGFNHSAILTGTGGSWHVNNTIQIGNGGTNDSLTISDGSRFDAGQIQVNGASLILNGGSFSTPSLVITNGGAQPSTVLLTGGTAFVTNTTRTGQLKLYNGSLILSNGATLIADTFTNLGATFTNLGGTFISKNQVIIKLGTATFSGGTSQFGSTLAIANSANSTGLVTISGGGLVTVNSNLVVGDCGLGAVGLVMMSGGTLFVTNAAHNAVLEVRDGQFLMDGGALVADHLVMTNACGLFQRNGGTTTIGTFTLDPNLSADGDGIPNSWKEQFHLDVLDPTLGNQDSDGDGMINLQEFLAGTDPTNNASSFRVTSIVTTGNDLLVTWTMGSGKTNALQRTGGTLNGSYETNNFTDLFIVTNTLGTTTNYLDSGGATNIPARYYRVRLVP